MNYKLVYFENDNIRIDVRDNNISYLCKASVQLNYCKKEIDFALNVFKYILKSLDELNNESQPERLSEKTSKDDAIV
jgi:hypothetical protein